MKHLINFFLLIPIILFSQQTVVEGVVLDDIGDPLPGATVQIQGVDQVGAITNFDGEFSVILDSPDQSIVVSYIGFISTLHWGDDIGAHVGRNCRGEDNGAVSLLSVLNHRHQRPTHCQT